MKIKDLIKELAKFNQEHEIMILDSFNGGGYPREINLFPHQRTIKKVDANECGDCEGRIGEKIVVMGYGCY